MYPQKKDDQMNRETASSSAASFNAVHSTVGYRYRNAVVTRVLSCRLSMRHSTSRPLNDEFLILEQALNSRLSNP